jgi:membrane-associated protease RseP (regulator of RpoE activity)
VSEIAVTQYFAYWRRVALGSREIVEGLVAREHMDPSRELEQALIEWDGYHYWEEAPEGRWLVLVREERKRRERWWLHAALFALTLVTTSLGGAALTGSVRDVWTLPTRAALASGLFFSLPLLAILLAHESGHYVAARRYRVDVSPPFFIPFPWQINILGTMGAFIRLRSPVFDRRTLFDIGAAGPLAGMLVACPLLVIGLALSEPSVNGGGVPFANQFIVIEGHPFFLGDSLLFLAIREVVAPDGLLRLHPLAVAGWVGILVTMLNMLPLAQLDGGHVTFALFGRAQTWIARVFWVALVLLGLLWWGWWIWAALGLILGRGRLSHPRIIAPERLLGKSRRWVGYTALAVFIVTFMPVPIAVF